MRDEETAFRGAGPTTASPLSSPGRKNRPSGPRGRSGRRRKFSMADSEQNPGAPEVEQTIGRMERLYETLTGRAVPRNEAPYAPIPAEKDPAEHVERQLNHLLTLLGDLGGGVRPLPLTSWTPAMSVWESHTEIRICLDLPGVARDQVQV